MGNGKRSAKLNKLTRGRFFYYLFFSVAFLFSCGKPGRDLKQTRAIMMSGVINSVVVFVCRYF